MSKGIDPEGITVPPDLYVITGHGDKVHVRSAHGFSSYCGHIGRRAMWRTDRPVTCRTCAKYAQDENNHHHRPVVPWGETMNETSDCICGLTWFDCIETTRLEELLAKSVTQPLNATQIRRLINFLTTHRPNVESAEAV